VKLISIALDAGNLERNCKSFRPLFPEVPNPTSDDVKSLLDDLARKTPKAAEDNLQDFVNDVSSMRRNGQGLSGSFTIDSFHGSNYKSQGQT